MTEPLSPSQYSTFDCLRRGVLTYVYGLRQPPTAAMALGTSVHALAERYLKTGQEPSIDDGPEGMILLPGLEFAPPPGTAVVEGKIEFETEHSSWQGFRDAVYTPGAPRVVGNGHVRVLDWKTTSDFKYMKDLTTDVQANLYLYELLEQGAREVSAQWIYLRTKGKPAARQDILTADRSQVYDTVSRIDARAEIIHLLKDQKPLAQDVEPNIARCNDFGGCRFRGKECKVSATQMFGKEVAMSSILDRLKAKKVDSKGFTIVKGHNFDTGTGEPLTADSPEELTAKSMGYGEPTRAELLAEQGDKFNVMIKQKELGGFGTPEQGFINPPDLEPYVSSYSGQEPVVDSAADELTSREAIKARCVALGLCDANDRRREPALRALLQANDQAKEMTEILSTGYAERERCQAAGGGTGMQEEDWTSLPDWRKATGEEIISAINDDRAAMNIRAPKPIYTLYIGCLPSRPVCDAQSIIAEVLPKVLETLGQGHVGLADFGKGAALLAAAVDEYLQIQNFQDVFADRFLEPKVLEVLVRLSGAVVRGL